MPARCPGVGTCGFFVAHHIEPISDKARRNGGTISDPECAGGSQCNAVDYLNQGKYVRETLGRTVAQAHVPDGDTLADKAAGEDEMGALLVSYRSRASKLRPCGGFACMSLYKRLAMITRIMKKDAAARSDPARVEPADTRGSWMVTNAA